MEARALARARWLEEHLVAHDLQRILVATEQRREALLDLRLPRQRAAERAALGDLVQLVVLQVRDRLVVEQALLLECLDARLQRRHVPRAEQALDDQVLRGSRERGIQRERESDNAQGSVGG